MATGSKSLSPSTLLSRISWRLRIELLSIKSIFAQRLSSSMASPEEMDDTSEIPSPPKNTYKDPDGGRQRFLRNLNSFSFLQILLTSTVVPHITDAIQEWIERAARIPVDGQASPVDVCVIELGGTIESKIDEKTLQVKRKDELVAEKEKLLQEKEDKIASLQTEV